MSSRVAKGGAEGAQSIQWRPVGPPVTHQDHAFPAPAQSGDGARVVELEARIRVLSVEAEQRSEAAFQRGLKQGEGAARQQISAQVNTMMERLARSLEEISGLKRRFRRESEADVVKLALAIAKRVLHRELTIDPDALLGLVKAALEKLDAREVQRVRVHPDDAPLLQQYVDRMGLPRRLEVAGDSGLERGAAIFETARGTLDASADTQLAEIERGFTDLVRQTIL